jgi:hypothetical protein
LQGARAAPRAADVAAAFKIAERARARSLLDALAPSAPARSGPESEEMEKRRNEARDSLGEALARLADARTRAERTAARSQVDGARAAVEKLDIAAGIGSERSKAAGPQNGPLELATVQQKVLRADEGMLEYFVGESKSWVFTIMSTDASVREVPPAHALGDRAAAFIAAASRASTGAGEDTRTERKAAEELAAVLMPAGLPRGSRLLVAPDGPLRHIPFEALISGGRFLIETREVVIVPSATTLALLRGIGPDTRLKDSHRDAKGFLGVADPVVAEGGDALPPLPFARREVEEIAGLFPEADRKVLVGADATRSKVLAAEPGNARFIHFGAHAWLDPESPRNTGLRLGVEKPGAEGTLLGVDDIQSLPLSADLVVVSACSSAQGEALRGEGLSGLTRAFLNAGSRAVVVSLWDVPDRSTADFMLDFYEGVTSGQSAAGALRASKLRFLSSKVPGRDRILRWAPFILVGDPGQGNDASNPSAHGATH